MTADFTTPDFFVVEVPAVWRVLAVGACLVASGTAGAAVASGLLLTLAGAAGSRGAEAFAAELRARALQRLRAVEAAVAATVILAVTALIVGLAS
jgi:hypothetical protein